VRDLETKVWLWVAVRDFDMIGGRTSRPREWWLLVGYVPIRDWNYSLSFG